MVEVRKRHSDPTFINALVNGEVAPFSAIRVDHFSGPAGRWCLL